MVDVLWRMSVAHNQVFHFLVVDWRGCRLILLASRVLATALEQRLMCFFSPRCTKGCWQLETVYCAWASLQAVDDLQIPSALCVLPVCGGKICPGRSSTFSDRESRVRMSK
jgi:hypothetical protein